MAERRKKERALQASPTSRRLFQQGLAEVIFEVPGRILETSKDTEDLPAAYEEAEVMWDILWEGGFNLELLRDHLKPTRANIVTMGRLVGAKGIYDKDYVILKRDNSLKSKKPDWFFYDAYTEVYPWTQEMTQAYFHVGVMGGAAADVERPRIVTKVLGSIEPDRFGWDVQNVLTEESIRANRGQFDSGAWLAVYDWAIPPTIPIPDLSMFARQMSFDF